MRNLAIGFALAVVAFIIYTIVARRSAKLAAARKRYFDACDHLDITHPEGEQFLEFLHRGSTDKKYDEAYYDQAIIELHRRVTTPRSVSRDRRSIETIEPSV